MAIMLVFYEGRALERNAAIDALPPHAGEHILIEDAASGAPPHVLEKGGLYWMIGMSRCWVSLDPEVPAVKGEPWKSDQSVMRVLPAALEIRVEARP